MIIGPFLEIIELIRAFNAIYRFANVSHHRARGLGRCSKPTRRYFATPGAAPLKSDKGVGQCSVGVVDIHEYISFYQARLISW